MTCRDEARRVCTTAIARRSRADRELLAESLNAEYGRRATNQPFRKSLNDWLVVAQGPVAAYAMGLHHQVHGDATGAEQWLRVAAGQSIGDAALRLARLCERREVERFNASLIEHLDSDRRGIPAVESEASYWYAVAAEEGYEPTFGIAGAGEAGIEAFACCPEVTASVAQTRAFQIVEHAHFLAAEIVAAAHADAEVIRTDARKDGKVIFDMARREYSLLTTRSRALESMIKQQGAIYMQLREPKRFRWQLLRGLGRLMRRRGAGRGRPR